MRQSKREFLVNLRNAAGFLSPTVQPAGIRLASDELERQMRAAALWLTPKAVEGFDSNAFDSDELTDDKRAELEQAVAEFLDVARKVPADEPATAEQYDQALGPFLTILETMMPFLEDFRIYPLLRRAQQRGEFPNYVRDFAVRVGFDVTDEPAAWVYVMVEDAAAREAIRKFGDIRSQVHEIFRQEQVELYPYVWLRTVSEQDVIERTVHASNGKRAVQRR